MRCALQNSYCYDDNHNSDQKQSFHPLQNIRQADFLKARFSRLLSRIKDLIQRSLDSTADRAIPLDRVAVDGEDLRRLNRAIDVQQVPATGEWRRRRGVSDM